VAACAFAEVCRREKWTAGAFSGSTGVARGNRRQNDPPTQPQQQGPADRAHTPSPRTLEVEADLNDTPGQAVVRFYLNEDGRRTVLRLQRLHNEAERAHARRTASGAWSETDAEFLRWLRPELRGKNAVRQNLTALKIPETRFTDWLERWETVPGRFIERRSQHFLTRRGPEQARMVVELTGQGEWIQIGAVIVMPNGVRKYVHEVFAMLASGSSSQIIDGHVLEFTPPVSWSLIKEVFAKKNPRMRRVHICEHLPHLLEGRIDIVEGDCVRHREVPGPDVRIQAIPDGADVLLEASVGRHPLDLDAAAVTGDIAEEEGVFLITVFRGAAISAARRFLSALQTERTGEGRYRISGTPERMAQLREAWKNKPEEIHTDTDARLKTLLEETCTVTPLVGAHESRTFVDFDLAWDIAGHTVSDSDFCDAIRAGTGLLRTHGGSWLAIDPDEARELRQAIALEGFEDGNRLRLLKPDAQNIASRIVERHHARKRGTMAALLAEEPPVIPPLPAALATIMRPYQKRGFEFLANRTAYGIGPILADDMGLGKTLQVLALLQALQTEQPNRPLRVLVVCPASVVSVWLEQADQFCPDLDCRSYTGDRDARREMLAGNDWSVLVANYAIVRTDAEVITPVEFDMIVLDEAQQIKNPDSQISQVVKALNTERTLALTGTPLENRLLDLWSIMDFLNPGFLGDKDAFISTYEAPSRSTELARRIAPLMLRRTKEAVAPELPPRTEEVLRIDLADEQQALYNAELARARDSLQQRGAIEMLAALTRLRQICCHPQLLLKETTDLPSAKLDTLVEMLAELIDEGHSALVFSQFTSMLALIGDKLDDDGLPWLKITGSTPTGRRTELVRSFNDSDQSQVFLLSLRAAGTGITLTKADYVFIYDPWWNPAVEQQAIDRTHRIGQDKPVFAYRLISTRTVEEKVLDLQEHKARMFDDVMADTTDRAVAAKLTQEDIRNLLSQ
jgi:superfamily II DNA or RNA helicase